jgi:hypothetical protein
VTCESSWKFTSPYVPGVIERLPCFGTSTSAPPAHENDGNGGVPAIIGAVNEFGPEFFGVTSEPLVV